MQNVKIPVVIDLHKAAQQRLTYSGVIPADKLSRLAESVESIDTDIKVTFECGTDEQGLLFIKGESNCSASAVCQRCGELVELELAVSFAFTPWNEESSNDEEPLPERYEPLEYERLDDIHIWNLFEDELILSVPLIPMHDDVNCHAPESERHFGEIEETPKENPFDVLKQLKRK